MDINHSVTCPHCGNYADERETIRLEEEGCSELEIALNLKRQYYGGVAEFHHVCLEELTRNLTEEERFWIYNADQGMTPADMMPLQDEISND